MNKKSKQIVTNNGHQKIVCINPNLVMQRHDLFTTGITYMPFGLAYFTGTLKSAGYNCQVVDAFGENPNQFWEENNLIFRGITPKEIIDKINVKSPELPFAFFVYASNVAYHSSIINIIRELRHSFLEIKIVVLEHSQAVTAYALEKVQDELYDAGATYVVMGESEERSIDLLRHIKKQSNDNEERHRIVEIHFRVFPSLLHHTWKIMNYVL